VALRYVMLVKVANKDTESVVSALIKQSLRLPSELYRSLTWDRGKELADHQRCCSDRLNPPPKADGVRSGRFASNSGSRLVVKEQRLAM